SSGSFALTVQFEKQEIHTVFLCFPNLLSNQNLSLSALADLFRASLKMGEYFVYFPFLELHGWDKRFAVQPQVIYSEVP
ncbi:MAG: hypothetical protein SOW29_04975, partial [Candidatus Faecousia sp.]|nr:hypothetical protein [Candidatus Faecousia sp.]